MKAHSAYNTEFKQDNFGFYQFVDKFMSGGHSEVAPPLPIPNRTVKRLSADDSAAFAV